MLAIIQQVSHCMQVSVVNLTEQTFEQVIDAQIRAYHLIADIQCIDSTMIASNIRGIRRLHLLEELLQRVHFMLYIED